MLLASVRRTWGAVSSALRANAWEKSTHKAMWQLLTFGIYCAQEKCSLTRPHGVLVYLLLGRMTIFVRGVTMVLYLTNTGWMKRNLYNIVIISLFGLLRIATGQQTDGHSKVKAIKRNIRIL
ncbi:hypothetical protein Bpfe_021238 [Biomphalaria pfeifferi]|uniref:Uncharacterized protein n=1 Tax=Biomphalaria pfeifferi TaxID=112525 RepID=A0AAD8B9R6_BIOPF|nr:hypothetical protein Bpfe_021238 [Biomphalaria pfeifferi]